MIKNNISLKLSHISKKSIPKDKFERDFKYYLEKHGYKIESVTVKHEDA